MVVAFGITAFLTRVLCSDYDGYTSFWSANAAMLAAFLTLPLRFAAGVVICCLTTNYLLNNMFSHLIPSEAFLACCLNAVQAMLAAPFTRRYCGSLTDLSRPRRFARFTVIAIIVSAVEAATGVAIEMIFLGDDATPFGEWLQWVFCDAQGLILGTPPMMLLARWPVPHRRAVVFNRTDAAWLMSCILWALLSFYWSYSVLFLFIYPLLTMVALNSRPLTVYSSIFCVGVAASAMTARGFGPIAQLSPDGSLLREAMIQPFLFSLSLVVVPVSNVIAERSRYLRRLLSLTQRLEEAVTHDALTGVLTRARFDKLLGAMVRKAEGGAVLFIDIDDFKLINDDLGHQAGDTVLRQGGARLLNMLASYNGIVARVGGDEFAVLLPHITTKDTLVAFCGRLSHALGMPYQLAGMERKVTASIGAALLFPECVAMSDIMHQADIALYKAKHAGKGRYAIFEIATPEPVLNW